MKENLSGKVNQHQQDPHCELTDINSGQVLGVAGELLVLPSGAGGVPQVLAVGQGVLSGPGGLVGGGGLLLGRRRPRVIWEI